MRGFGSLLSNDNPGVDFRAGDLVKNLLLSAFLEKSVSFQDEVYQKLSTPGTPNIIRDNRFIGFAYRVVQCNKLVMF